ncbi:MAG TPA: hypothetical protein DCS29_03955 [Candidatus Magasanikbacteria bacterium]|nr:hypothetical protein [Candidatus Magasanikbacteria bacterium]
MSEIITTYQLTDLDQQIPMDRDEFYDDQIEVYKKTGKPTRAAAIADIFLFTPESDVILQKRSYRKKHNPGLLDKTMGGHIKFGDTPNYTVMVETLEELNVPSIVTFDFDEFQKTYKLLKSKIGTTAILQFIDSHSVNLEKIFGTEKVLIGNKYFFYLGIYNGSLKPADREAAGLIFIPYDQLQEEIQKTPELYSADVKFFLSKYSSEIEKFLKNLN